ncbi:nitroreductase family protein [Psychrobacillus sp. AK 1817]|uniref:nitroreductase family protein n=1 Tax=Psychrobacillus sp. AK 1817 TaxID=2303505 RepID=UPI0012485A60|nr:nitroreductase family protein [Psychrobacillus sp. AK 1817]QEY22398.1 nitroreductase family protein [Psychrobacillus sp. AK 1817]QGM29284.1 nitroreductase family protein [Bacillus sp. N3536]
MPKTQTTIDQLIHERKSVRKYKENVVIPHEEIQTLLQKAITAPSSSNMQPWRFIVIEDQQVKKELRVIANNQEQVETSSAIIAVLGDLEMYKNAEKIYDANYEQKFMPRELADLMIKNSLSLYGNLPQETMKNIVHFDAGLISMQIMLLAKDMGYDTVPMGGFDKVKFAEKFNLLPNEVPILLIAIGEAAAPAYGSSRLPLEQIVRYI